MIYFSTKEATGWKEKDLKGWRVRLLYILLFFIPRANPDNEALYPKVATWLLEVDEAGIPKREIGLDSEGQPLFAAPDRRNYGLWTDNPDEPVNRSTMRPIDPAYFEGLWKRVAKNA
jgi:hypothetical protein